MGRIDKDTEGRRKMGLKKRDKRENGEGQEQGEMKREEKGKGNGKEMK